MWCPSHGQIHVFHHRELDSLGFSDYYQAMTGGDSPDGLPLPFNAFSPPSTVSFRGFQTLPQHGVTMNGFRNPLLIASFAIVFPLSHSLSQDPPITWGVIPPEDLAMKTFPDDTNAAAVILCDYGTTYFDDELDMVHEQHTRIKILTTKGYDWGTVSISLYTKDGTQRISKIQGATYLLDSTGAMRTIPLDDDDVFTENVTGDRVRYKFTLPALAPGCIIEYRYRTTTTSLFFIPDWVFQHSEPVRWSEYRVRTPRSISYAYVTTGYERFAIAQRREVTQVFRPPASGYLQTSGITECIEYRYALANARALRDEPYITTLADYATRIDFQLSAYSLAGTGIRRILQTWSSLIDELLDAESFGDMIDVTGDIEDVAEEVTRGLSTPHEKLRAIYGWVSSSIVWDGSHRMYADKDVDAVLEAKRGNSAEITFALLSLLKAAGIEAHPVILSTRSNGRIQEMYPILAQFNYVIAKAVIGDKTFFLDATDPRRPPELLPTRVLNVRGLVVQKGTEEWVTLESPARGVSSGMALLTIDSEGAVRGEVTISYKDYANLSARQDLREKTDLEVARAELKAGELGLEVDSVAIEHRENHHEPLTIRAWISSASMAQKIGEKLYLNPTVLFRVTDSPFKNPRRQFPVDFAHGWESLATVELRIPEDYEIRDAPPARSYTIPGKASFARGYERDGDAMKVSTSLSITATTLEPKLYPRLRELYNRVASAHADQIVLERKPARGGKGK